MASTLVPAPCVAEKRGYRRLAALVALPCGWRPRWVELEPAPPMSQSTRSTPHASSPVPSSLSYLSQTLPASGSNPENFTEAASSSRQDLSVGRPCRCTDSMGFGLRDLGNRDIDKGPNYAARSDTGDRIRRFPQRSLLRRFRTNGATAPRGRSRPHRPPDSWRTPATAAHRPPGPSPWLT